MSNASVPEPSNPSPSLRRGWDMPVSAPESSGPRPPENDESEPLASLEGHRARFRAASLPWAEVDPVSAGTPEAPEWAGDGMAWASTGAGARSGLARSWTRPWLT